MAGGNMNKLWILELKAIIACGQSDGYLKAWAKEELKKLAGTMLRR